MLTALVFGIDLGCKFAYIKASKFINSNVEFIFLFFLFGRFVAIVLYHLYRCAIHSHHVFIETQEKKKEQKDQLIQRATLTCNILDIIIQLVMLPGCMFLGLNRFV